LIYTIHTGRGNEKSWRGARAPGSEEAEEDGGAEHEEPDDVDELQRLAGEGRRAGADLAVAALGDARPRARGLGAAAPVRDPVGAADRVGAEAPNGARRGVAAPVRHGGRAGVDGFRVAGGGQGWGQEERERREEEEEAVAGGMGGPRHGGEGWARGGDHGGLWGGRRLELRARWNGSAAALGSFSPLATRRRWVKGGWVGVALGRPPTLVVFSQQKKKLTVPENSWRILDVFKKERKEGKSLLRFFIIQSPNRLPSLRQEPLDRTAASHESNSALPFF
jgi:hypothetical protein